VTAAGVRWLNLILGAILAVLLLSEAFRAMSPAPPAQGEVKLSAPTIYEPPPARRSRRAEARARLEEARRHRRERAEAALRSGPVLLGDDGQPLRD
jgi:hypothetical protein